jgi:D-glycero-alpha-D-manno-heptose-7-phosphate kinase
MIISRSPLRITLGGGGTDLPSYYKRKEGFLVSAAINKYVYVTIIRPFTEGIYLKYSKIEKVKKVLRIHHPIIRETLKLQKLKLPQIEITTLADIPAGTGLGSSGSFTTALIKSLYAYNKKLILPQDLAKLACHIEIDILKEPIGKQDQYISSYGGVTCFTFKKNDKVKAEPLKISSYKLTELEDNLLLFFTGYSRNAGIVLKEQDTKTKKNESKMIENLNFVKQLGLKSKKFLETGKLDQFADLMNEHWEFKQSRSKKMSNKNISKWYYDGLKNGAIGGKLVGAGGGGFLMFYANDKEKLRRKMSQNGLQEVRFNFDFQGTQTILS